MERLGLVSPESGMRQDWQINRDIGFPLALVVLTISSREGWGDLPWTRQEGLAQSTRGPESRPRPATVHHYLVYYLELLARAKGLSSSSCNLPAGGIKFAHENNDEGGWQRRDVPWQTPQPLKLGKRKTGD